MVGRDTDKSSSPPATRPPAKRLVTFLVASCCVTLLSAVGTASASTNNPATNPPKVQTKVPPPVTTDTTDCYTLEKQTYRDASGIETAQSRPDTAVVSTYVNKSGGHYISILPPASFDSRTATDEALAAFGLNPRPASGTAREEWDKQYVNFTHFETSTPAEQCSINAQFTTDTSQN